MIEMISCKSSSDSSSCCAKNENIDLSEPPKSESFMSRITRLAYISRVMRGMNTNVLLPLPCFFDHTNSFFVNILRNVAMVEYAGFGSEYCAMISCVVSALPLSHKMFIISVSALVRVRVLLSLVITRCFMSLIVTAKVI